MIEFDTDIGDAAAIWIIMDISPQNPYLTAPYLQRYRNRFSGFRKRYIAPKWSYLLAANLIKATQWFSSPSPGETNFTPSPLQKEKRVHDLTHRDSDLWQLVCSQGSSFTQKESKSTTLPVTQKTIPYLPRNGFTL